MEKINDKVISDCYDFYRKKFVSDSGDETGKKKFNSYWSNNYVWLCEKFAEENQKKNMNHNK